MWHLVWFFLGWLVPESFALLCFLGKRGSSYKAGWSSQNIVSPNFQPLLDQNIIAISLSTSSVNDIPN